MLSLLPSVWRKSLAIHDLPHIPVLGQEVVAWLDVEPGMTVVDGTFGAGGHAALLAEAMDGRGTYVAVDRDPTAREHFDRFAAGFPDVSARWVRGNFALALRNLAATGVRADAVVLDLGVSSCSSTDRSAGSPTPSTRRSTCGWTRARSARPRTS